MIPTTARNRKAVLLALVEEGFVRKAWHGTNLRGSLRGLTAAKAAWRPSPDRHNIWENVVHAAYWKYIVRRRILGEKRGSFPYKGSNWFTRPVEASERSWREDVRLLERMHRSMCKAIESLSERDLNKKPKGSRVSNASIIAGIACHDVYHTGQIQLLKRLQRGIRRR